MARVEHVQRAIPWVAVAVSALPGLLVVGLGLGFHDRDWSITAVRNGLLLLAVPAAFFLDDPCAPVVSSAPRSPWWDIVGRLTGLSLGLGVLVGLVWVWDLVEPTEQAWVLALIPVCLALLGVASASLLRRIGRQAPGDVVAGALGLTIMALVIANPSYDSWELLPWPGLTGAAEAAVWASAGMLALVLVGWATSGRGSRLATDA